MIFHLFWRRKRRVFIAIWRFVDFACTGLTHHNNDLFVREKLDHVPDRSGFFIQNIKKHIVIFIKMKILGEFRCWDACYRSELVMQRATFECMFVQVSVLWKFLDVWTLVSLSCIFIKIFSMNVEFQFVCHYFWLITDETFDYVSALKRTVKCDKALDAVMFSFEGTRVGCCFVYENLSVDCVLDSAQFQMDILIEFHCTIW